jgi:hypothetical protein
MAMYDRDGRNNPLSPYSSGHGLASAFEHLARIAAQTARGASIGGLPGTGPCPVGYPWGFRRLWTRSARLILTSSLSKNARAFSSHRCGLRGSGRR